MKKIIIFLGIIVLFSGFASAALTDGLVSYWDFDEGSGGIAYDSAGSNDGTLKGNPQWVTGKVGDYALDFDGSGDYVDVSHSSDLEPQLITVAAWVNPDQMGDNEEIIGKGGNNKGYILRWRSDGSFQFMIGQSNNWYGNGNHPSNTLSNGAWTHLAAVFNGTHIIGYADGSVDWTESADITRVTGNEVLYIGASSYYSGDREIDGQIDEVGIWNRALTEEEVGKLFEGGNPLIGDGNGTGVVPEFSTTGMILAVVIAIIGIGLVVKKRR